MGCKIIALGQFGPKLYIEKLQFKKYIYQHKILDLQVLAQVSQIIAQLKPKTSQFWGPENEKFAVYIK